MSLPFESLMKMNSTRGRLLCCIELRKAYPITEFQVSEGLW